MFRTTIKIISTVLAAAAVAVPVASAGSNPTTQHHQQVFSLGTALAEYQQKNEARTPSVGQGFSLGVPLRYLNTGAPTHVTQGFSLGVPTEYLAQPTATAGARGFDWSSAGIGAAIVAGAFLLIGGIGAMTIRARQGHRAGRLSAT